MAEPRVILSRIDQAVAAEIDSDYYGGAVIYSNRGPTDPTLYTDPYQFADAYGDPDPDSSADYHGKLSVMAFLKEAPCWVMRVVNGALYGGVTIEDDVGGGSAALSSGVSSPDDYAFGSGSDVTFLVVGANPGEWNDNIRITIDDVSGNEFTITVEFTTDGGTTWIVVETWEVSKSQTGKDGYGRSLYMEDVVNGNSNYIYIVDNTENTNAPEEVSTLQFNGGDDGSAPSVSNYTSAWTTMQNNIEDLDLLFTAGQLIANASYSTFINAMNAVAVEHVNCFVVADVNNVAYGTAISTVGGWSLTNAGYCGLYYPWIQITDEINDKTPYIPPSGYVASRFMAAYNAGNIWDAPAGPTRGVVGGALDLSQDLGSTERGLVCDARINPLRKLKGLGIVIWDQYTQYATASPFRFINVQQTISSIERAARDFLFDFLHENNTSYTRERVERGIDNLLSAYTNAPGGQGITAGHCVCDTTNNTSQVIQNGIMYVDVYLVPVYPAREISFRVIVTDADVYVAAS